MSQFIELINQAKSDPQRQRFLFLFAKATNLMEEKDRGSYNSGTIESVMCVDKSPEELTTFNSLVEEADGQTKKWDFIFASTISGKGDNDPLPQEVDSALHKMSNAFSNGEDLSQYVVWDREEKIIVIS